MLKTIVIASALVAVSALSTGCYTLTPAQQAKYDKVSAGEYRLAGHPYKSAKDCERTAPIGKFDKKCDIPLVGIRNFSDPTPGALGAAGGIGGVGVGGM